MDDPTKRDRDTAEQFGNDVEEVFGDLGKTYEGLQEGPREPRPAPDHRPGDDGGDINITTNR